MTKIQLELNKQQNRVIEIVKATKELKTKSEAITHIIDDYSNYANFV